MKENLEIFTYSERISIMNPEIIPIEHLILLKNYCKKEVWFTFCDGLIEVAGKREHLYTFIMLLADDYNITLH